jgi:uncharacterized protein (TIGR02246 family)
MNPSDDWQARIRGLYRAILEVWNGRSGDDFAAPFADDGDLIGFDGSENKGRAAIAQEMERIFGDHETGRYVGLVRSVRTVGSDAAVLRAAAGIGPGSPGISWTVG